MTYLPQLESQLLEAGAELARRRRWSRHWVARRTQSPGPRAVRPSRRRPLLARGLAAVPIVLAVGATLVVAVIALAVIGHGHAPTATPGPVRAGVGTSFLGGPGQSARDQALELYAPVVAFDRATTAHQRAQMRAAPRTLATRINACQTRYAKPLFRSMTAHSPNYKVYRLYELGATLQDTQATEAVVAPQVATAAHSWATMVLKDPRLQRVAKALAAQIEASLSAPKLDGCTFLHELQQHHFSLSWARASVYGKTATRFEREASKEAAGVSLGYRYLLEQKHLLTFDQWSGIVNFPGIQG
jgi:hypothetical protein